MISFMPNPRRLRRNGVLGLNARNAQYVLARNDRKLYPLVDNKIRCKRRLQEAGIAVPQLLASAQTLYEAGGLMRGLQGMHEFVCKPALGSGGDGILVLVGRRSQKWVSAGGRAYDADDVRYHLCSIVNGLFSLAGQPDEALLEALVHPDPQIRELAPIGVADIRVLVYRGVPVMAMIRIPTHGSGGKANLHQGAIGAGICLTTGRTLTAVMNDRMIERHPDTGARIRACVVPRWGEVLDLAARCHEAAPLGYLGVDIVLDAYRGPLVLELNARPGLAIQIANRTGLNHRLERIDEYWAPGLTARERIALGREVAADCARRTERASGPCRAPTNPELALDAKVVA